jgi:predicted PurR-regulated permease PerM
MTIKSKRRSMPLALPKRGLVDKRWWWLTALLLVAIVAVVFSLGPVLVPFVTAAVLAYALAPLADKLVALRLPRVFAVALVIVLFGLCAVGVLLLIVPVISKEIPLLRVQIPALIDRLNEWLNPLLASHGIKFRLDASSLRELVTKMLSENAQDVTSTVLSSFKIGGNAFLAILGNLVLIPVALFYLLMDWTSLVARAQSLLPTNLRERVLSFMDECDNVLAQYLRGQLLVMLILAVFYAGGLALAGYDLALPIGLFTGLAMFIPYLGFGIGLLLALMAGLLQFSPTYALLSVAIVYGLGQLIESLFLTPRLVGERIGLHPLAVIFALLAFGQLFGFIGVLVALPASAVVAVGARRALVAYRESQYYKAV